MLGFSSISETAIAEQPGTSLFVSGFGTTSAIGAAGTQTTGAANIVNTSLNMTSSLGAASITGTASVTLTGFSTTLSQGNVLIWGEIQPGITTNYTNITTGASQTWTEISTGASQTWTEI